MSLLNRPDPSGLFLCKSVDIHQHSLRQFFRGRGLVPALNGERKMNKFEAGKTYSTRSICDHNCIITVEVISRTAKTIKAKADGGVKTFRIAEYQGVEYVKPWGSYSMAPIVRAA